MLPILTVFFLIGSVSTLNYFERLNMTISTSYQPVSLIFSENQEKFIVHYRTQIAIYNGFTFQLLQRFVVQQSGNYFSNIAISPGSLYMTLTEDNEEIQINHIPLYRWDYNLQQFVRSKYDFLFPTDVQFVRDLQFSRDGYQLVAGSVNETFGNVTVFQVPNTAIESTDLTEPDEQVTAMGQSIIKPFQIIPYAASMVQGVDSGVKTGNLLVTILDKSEEDVQRTYAVLLNSSRGYRQIKRYQVANGSDQSSKAVFASNQSLALSVSGQGNSKLAFWNVQDGQKTQTLPQPENVSINAYTKPHYLSNNSLLVSSAALVGDGQNRKKVVVWQRNSLKDQWIVSKPQSAELFTTTKDGSTQVRLSARETDQLGYLRVYLEVYALCGNMTVYNQETNKCQNCTPNCLVCSALEATCRVCIDRHKVDLATGMCVESMTWWGIAFAVCVVLVLLAILALGIHRSWVLYKKSKRRRQNQHSQVDAPSSDYSRIDQ